LNREYNNVYRAEGCNSGWWRSEYRKSPGNFSDITSANELQPDVHWSDDRTAAGALLQDVDLDREHGHVQLRHDHPMMAVLRAHKVAVAGLCMAAGLGILGTLVVLGLFSGSASAVELPPVARQMRAFAAPPVQPEALPANVATGLERMADPRTYGAPILGETRRLRGDLGANRVGLFAVPTTGGVVCFLVNERTYVGSCASEFSLAEGNVAVALYYGEDVPITVAGLASDDVKRVSVVVDGRPRPASLKNNVLFWQSDSAVITRGSLDELRVGQRRRLVSHDRDTVATGLRRPASQRGSSRRLRGFA
jgi:hypothetical protein